ncbi:MAG: ABC transporter permease subunit [Holosporales bacterium]|jgi:putrescine transport system permease protein|nr:ABC transporter permease subunit [Holosporales bacterium]
MYGQTKNSSFWLGIIPTTWLVLFFIAPLVIVLQISFSETVFSVPPYTEIFAWTKTHFLQITLNLQNYFSLIKDSYYKNAFLNSFAISFMSTFICIVIGYMIAYAISQVSPRRRPLLILLVSISFWTSLLIRVYSWMNLLSPQGFVNSLLMKLGVIDSHIHFLGNYYAVSLGIVFCYLPFVIFPVYAVLEKVSASCIEAAEDLGAHPFRVFWAITVPLSKSGILTGGVLVLAATIGEFVIPELLGGPDAITIGRVLWMEFFNNLDWPMACAMSIVLAFFTIIPILFLKDKSVIVN